jgi:hypothetical protein
MKKFMLFAALMLTCIFLSGCIGFVVAHPREKTMEHFCLGERGVITNTPPSIPLTETELLLVWGPPDAIQTNNEALTVWHYQGAKDWSIIMPAYLIGLPIPVPAGHHQADIYFKDGFAVKARGSVQVLTGAMIGIQGPFVLAWEKEENHGKAERQGAYVGGGLAKESPPDKANP